MPSNCSAISEDEYFSIKYFLEANNVDSNTSNILMQNLCNGVEWDSMKTGQTPISVERTYMNDRLIETSRYSDGSLLVSDTPIFVQQANDDSRAVSGCSYTRAGNYAAYWKNCTASYNWGVYTLFFTFNYSLTKDIGSRIDSYSAPGHSAVGNITDVGIHRTAQNRVQYIATWVLGPWMSKTIGFNLETRGTNAYTFGL